MGLLVERVSGDNNGIANFPLHEVPQRSFCIQDIIRKIFTIFGLACLFSLLFSSQISHKVVSEVVDDDQKGVNPEFLQHKFIVRTKELIEEQPIDTALAMIQDEVKEYIAGNRPSYKGFACSSYYRGCDETVLKGPSGATLSALKSHIMTFGPASGGIAIAGGLACSEFYYSDKETLVFSAPKVAFTVSKEENGYQFVATLKYELQTQDSDNTRASTGSELIVNQSVFVGTNSTISDFRSAVE